MFPVDFQREAAKPNLNPSVLSDDEDIDEVVDVDDLVNDIYDET